MVTLYLLLPLAEPWRMWFSVWPLLRTYSCDHSSWLLQSDEYGDARLYRFAGPGRWLVYPRHLARPGTEVAALVAFCTAVAMVSPLPIPRPHGLGLVAFVLWPIALLILHLRAFSA